MDLVCGSLDLFAAAVVLMLLMGASFKNDYPKPLIKRFAQLMVWHIIGLLCDSVLWFWDPALFPSIDISVAVAVQRVLVVIAYGVLAGMTVLFTDCLVEYIREKNPVSYCIVPCVFALCVAAVVLWVISVFNGMYFHFDEKGMFTATEWYWLSQASIGLLLCVDLFLIVRYHKAIGWRKATPLLCYILLPVVGFFVSFWLDVTPVYIAASLSILMMFIVFHLGQNRQLLEQERQLAQGRIAIMLTQIQPHFLYNTLTAICGLCDENPKEAKKVTAEFAEYLRHNLESLNQSEPVPFEDELRHTRVYLGIEQRRFEGKLSIVYDTQVNNFRIPALTMQPLVENAVKHGVTKKKAGGTVTISTRERENFFEIIVADDGVGFDANAVQSDSRKHIGVENVRDRLWSVCHGKLDIVSEVGAGTVATIRLLKGSMLSP